MNFTKQVNQQTVRCFTEASTVAPVGSHPNSNAAAYITNLVDQWPDLAFRLINRIRRYSTTDRSRHSCSREYDAIWSRYISIFVPCTRETWASLVHQLVQHYLVFKLSQSTVNSQSAHWHWILCFDRKVKGCNSEKNRFLNYVHNPITVNGQTRKAVFFLSRSVWEWRYFTHCTGK